MRKFVLLLVISVSFLILGANSNALAAVVWTENFDDGSISDWTVENPYGGYTAITTLALSTEQSVSPSYSLKVSGPNQDGYGGRAAGPTVAVNLSVPYTIRFKFRYSNLEWYRLVMFGPVSLAVGTPQSGLRYEDENGFHMFGSRFDGYCPLNTWTEFRIEVRPAELQYDIYAGATYVGTVTLNFLWDSGYGGFGVQEDGGQIQGHTSFASNAYYDDLSIEGPNIGPIPTLNETGMVILILLLLAGAYMVIRRRPPSKA